MPSKISPLLRFLAINAAIGVGLGWALLAILIATDTMGLYSLIAGASNPIVPLAMLIVMFAVTVGAAVMGTAVLSMPLEKPKTPPTPHDPEKDRPR